MRVRSGPGMRGGVVVLQQAVALLAACSPLGAQSVLERTPNISAGWVGVPWAVHWILSNRFTTRDGQGIVLSPTFDMSLGLPGELLAGVRFAPNSGTVRGESDEWEFRGRWVPLRQDLGAPARVWVTGAFNATAGSADAELGAARWLGPVRLLGAVRGFTSPFDDDGARVALAGGAVWHPLPGALPIALAGDVASLIDRDDGEDIAWSAGIQVGLPFTDLTLSLQATNTGTTTLEGSSLGTGRLRLGFELTIPIPAGQFFGLYTSREAARAAVAGGVAATPAAVRVPIRRYAFTPDRLVIPAGSVVEWYNDDEVVHTATAEDGSWDSGAILPGASWRARFDRPWTYPYNCSPHPFMKGVIIVR